VRNTIAAVRIAGAPLLLALVAGCSSGDGPTPTQPETGKAPRDSLPDGLYHDFLDGKFDGAGHPLNAEVWQAEGTVCAARTGYAEAEGLGLWPGSDAADVVCSTSSATLGRGQFTLNVRSLVDETCRDDSCDPSLPVLTVRVASDDGQTIQERTVKWEAFLTPLTYQNSSLTFSHADIGPVSIEVAWAGQVKARVDYLELFRSHRNLLITPPSGPLEPDTELRIEVQDAPTEFTLQVHCGDLDLSEVLTEQLASGEATWEDTEFRTIVRSPAATLLEGCSMPSRVRVSMMSGSWVRATSRVTISDSPPDCSFEPGTTRVLLTGFEPFPAASNRDNSSERAVTGFDASDIANISVMSMILPVEFDTAPAMLADAIARCQPDVVVGFGQGRTEVDLEMAAYNLKDSSAISGGAPDNRGIIGEGDAIVMGGADELASGLPTAAIRGSLLSDNVAANLSDDPGRYVCNNLFYRLMAATNGSPAVAGFVHLPRIPVVTDADQAMLQTVVHHVVDQAVQQFRDGA